MIETLNNLFTSYNENDATLFIGLIKHASDAYQTYIILNGKYGQKNLKKKKKKKSNTTQYILFINAPVGLTCHNNKKLKFWIN